MLESKHIWKSNRYIVLTFTKTVAMFHEIITHARKIKNKMEGKKEPNSLKEKIQDIIIELAIIVFAVSLSTWFHDLGEQRLHQKEVSAFLVDLKVDLNKDIKGLESQKQLLLEQIDDFKFIRNLDQKQVDSLDKINTEYDVNSGFKLFFGKENSGNYESFESGGKTVFIKNKKLKILILSYYKQHIPTAKAVGGILITSFTKISDFLTKSIVVEKNKNKILLNSSFQTDAEITIKYAKENIEVGDAGISKIKEIIAEIDKELEK